MTKKTGEVTRAGAVELNEDALDQASGGVGPNYVKFGGLEVNAAQKVNEEKLSPAATTFATNPVNL